MFCLKQSKYLDLQKWKWLFTKEFLPWNSFRYQALLVCLWLFHLHKTFQELLCCLKQDISILMSQWMSLFKHLSGLPHNYLFCPSWSCCLVPLAWNSQLWLLQLFFHSIITCKPVIPNLFQVKIPYRCLFDFMKLVPFFLLKRK